MKLPPRNECYELGTLMVPMVLPDPQAVQQAFTRGELDSPFWSRVWPSARALGRYLVREPGLVRGKRVLEIAAGLGLPSIVAARLGAQVHCTEAEPLALEWIEASARANEIELEVTAWSWDRQDPLPACDVLLLSDVNYEPAAFEALHALLRSVLAQGSTVLLSTPQRLMAKDFIAGWLAYAVHQETLIIEQEGSEVPITLLQLRADRRA
jgi:predicted nicotinamide N-methyase